MGEEKQVALIPASSPVTDTLALLREMALNKDVDADKMDKMLSMHLRVMDKQAEIDFTQALTRMKPKLPKIEKNGMIVFTDKNGLERRTPHAKYEDIQAAIDPFLAEEGFSLSFDTEFQATHPTIIKCTLSHRGGHSKTISMPLPLDSSGSKNNLQAMGSTVRYGKRYLVDMMFDLIILGKDNDGADAGGIIDTEQAVEIDLLLARAKLSPKKWLEKTVKVADVRDIKARDYSRCVASLKAIILDKQDKEAPSASVP